MTAERPGTARTRPHAPAGLLDGGSATGREIAQQPRLWRQVAADREGRATARALLDPVWSDPALRIVLSGAGTSAFVGEILAPTLTRRLGRRVEAVATTDLVADPAGCLAQDVPTVMVSFARSGDSPESVAATQIADRLLTSVRHLVITCNADGALAARHRERADSQVLVLPEEAHDSGFAMTSSFTCMLLAAWFALDRSVDPGPLADQLARSGQALLAEREQDAVALAGRRHARVVWLGSGPLRGLARESALKLLELTGGEVVSYFDSPLGFRHGPKAVLDGQSLVVLYLSNDPHTRRYDEDLARELGSVLGEDDLLVVAARPPAAPHRGRLWRLPGLDEAPDVAAAAGFVLVAQLIALGASLAHGRTPDNPFPGGEVNRVVQGVSVHPYPGSR